VSENQGGEQPGPRQSRNEDEDEQNWQTNSDAGKDGEPLTTRRNRETRACREDDWIKNQEEMEDRPAKREAIYEVQHRAVRKLERGDRE